MPLMAKTLGTHWIATTYGTWLHGDPRGSWKDGRLIGPDPFLHEQSQRLMSHDAVVLDQHERDMVAESFGRTIRSYGYRAFTATIGATHVHVVFGPLSDPFSTVVARMKKQASNVVLSARRSRGHNAGPTMWTKRPFPRFLFDENHVLNGIEYVRRHNLRAGLPKDPYPWIVAWSGW